MAKFSPQYNVHLSPKSVIFYLLIVVLIGILFLIINNFLIVTKLDSTTSLKAIGSYSQNTNTKAQKIMPMVSNFSGSTSDTSNVNLNINGHKITVPANGNYSLTSDSADSQTSVAVNSSHTSSNNVNNSTLNFNVQAKSN